MFSILRFGADRQVRFDLTPEAVVADWSDSGGAPLADPVAAVVAALEGPLDLPPVAQALTPGDQIVLALDADTPQASLVVEGAIRALLDGGARPRNLTVVLSHRLGERGAPERLLPGDLRGEVTVEVHQPGEADALCYLATSEENLPIYLNRRIVEGDFVLPIGPLRLSSSFGYLGAWGGLFPAFADEETRRRFQTPAALESAAAGRLAHEADEAAWLLGVQFAVGVIAGRDDTVSTVLAGSGAAMREEGQRRCEAVWRRPVSRRASLVVAALSGGPDQQTWENFGRALYAASQAVTPDGAIALCTQLRRQPGPALKRLGGLDDLEVKQRAVHRQTTFDAQSASLLANLLEKNRVYLLSELDGELVEDLGLAYIASEDELARLSRLHRSCILLADAQYAMPET